MFRRMLYLVLLWEDLHEATQLLGSDVVIVAVHDHVHDVLVGAGTEIGTSFSINN